MTAEIHEFLDALYGSFATGDPSAWAQRLGDDVLVIGTDEAEWWQGKEDALRAVTSQLSEMSEAGIRVSPGEADVSDKGAFVLVADRPTLHLPDGSGTKLRMTMVISRVGEDLALEHLHLSVAAPNEDVVQQTLTV
jgi:ketosteroid isomerase-like protein